MIYRSSGSRALIDSQIDTGTELMIIYQTYQGQEETSTASSRDSYRPGKHHSTLTRATSHQAPSRTTYTATSLTLKCTGQTDRTGMQGTSGTARPSKWTTCTQRQGRDSECLAVSLNTTMGGTRN